MSLNTLVHRSIRSLAITPGVIVATSWAQHIPQNFTAVVPCRIADTRPASGGSGPIPGGTYQNFSVGGRCGVPATASAFSLNVTALPSGSLLYLSVIPAPTMRPTSPPSTSTLNDPLGTIIANAAVVPSGANGAVSVYVSDQSNVIIDIDGYFTDETTGTYNTAVGTSALASNTGSYNTALGFGAAYSNTSGQNNTASGYLALYSNTTSSDNSAFGYEALQNSTGPDNTALGSRALSFTTSGSGNTGVGAFAMSVNSTGNNNTALGVDAGASLRSGGQNTFVGVEAGDPIGSGSFNIAIGNDAGFHASENSSNSIWIGSTGFPGDNGVIEIGTPGLQTVTAIAGIYGTTVTGAAVLINSNGQLGVQSSSIRFKEDVQEIGASAGALMQLHPVQFRYKQTETDGAKPLQFGLIAEEVEKVFPELVVRGQDGKPVTVMYHELPALLLNELQVQRKTIEQLERKVEQLERDRR